MSYGSGAIPPQSHAQSSSRQKPAHSRHKSHNSSAVQLQERTGASLHSRPVAAPLTVNRLSDQDVRALYRQFNPVLPQSHVHIIDLSIVGDFGKRSSFVAFKRSDGLYQCYQISTNGQTTSVENWGTHARNAVPKGTDTLGTTVRFAFLEPQHPVSVKVTGVAGQVHSSILKFSESSWLRGLLTFRSLDFVTKDTPSYDGAAMKRFAEQFKRA